MRVKTGNDYVLVASQGGAPSHPLWYHNLKAHPYVTIQDETEIYEMEVREIGDSPERTHLWDIAVQAYPPYKDYQEKTSRLIPVFLAESK